MFSPSDVHLGENPSHLGALAEERAFQDSGRPKSISGTGLAAWVILVLALPSLAIAQGLSVPQPRLRDVLPPLPDLERAEPAPGLTFPRPPAQERPQPDVRGPTFLLRGIEFEGNTVFSDAELTGIASDFLDKPAGTEDLEVLRRRLTQHYIDAGYVNSGALLPDQTVIDGRLRIVIVEGVLDEVEVLGNERLSSDYVADRVRLAAGPPLNVNDLQRRLRIMLDDPLIRRVDAELLPGLRLGESRLRVTVAEEPVAGGVAYVDNAIQPSVGGEQIGAALTFRNLTGLGEIISVLPRVAEGFYEISGQFELPITSRDTRLIGRILYSESDVVESPFDELDIESETFELSVGVVQPLYRAPGKALTALLSYDYSRNETFLLGDRFSFSEGPENGRSVVSVFRGGVEWVERSQEQVVALRSVVSVGADLFDATTNGGDTPDSKFFALLGQAQYVRRLEPLDARLVLRGAAQWTEDRLLSLEKFGVGGVATVRGYREDLQLGDRGWNASLEVQVPILDVPQLFPDSNFGTGEVTFIPFIDAGRAWDINGPDTKNLVSAGAGLGLDVSPGLQARLFVGRGLMNRSDPADDNIQDIGIHFSLSAKLY